MELFYSPQTDGGICRLDSEESNHCVRVLRHRIGDEIHVIDGAGTLCRCELVSDAPKGAEARILETLPGWGGHPYRLTLAVCPTKNNDRYEWFAEKATEIGVDAIVPVIGERSERKVFKTDRLRKIVLSATKQSLKAQLPEVVEPMKVSAFIDAMAADDTVLKLIAYCFEDESVPRISVKQALRDFGGDRIAVLIGPEGDFSPEEARRAIAAGFRPVHLGSSRLRTETAAVTAAEAVYFQFM